MTVHPICNFGDTERLQISIRELEIYKIHCIYLP